jgi:hypothetical protein
MPKDVQAGRQAGRHRQAGKSVRQKDRQAATMVNLSIIRIQYIHLITGKKLKYIFVVFF